MYKTYEHCRISGSTNLVPFFKLNTALAGAFLKSPKEFETEQKFPLTVSFCPDSGLVQVNEVISGDVLFKNYFYKTGAIGTLVTHFQGLAKKIAGMKPKSVLEIGCNDFTMLKNLVGKVEYIHGVDPSDVADKNLPEGILLSNTFFNEEWAKHHNKPKFDVISASNCFAHIEDIDSVTRGIRRVLNKKGVAIIEVHWLGSLIKNLQFPFIYHEHMYYYSLQSMSYLLEKHGLEVVDIEKIDVHGGSIRFFVGHKGVRLKSQRVRELAKEEFEMGLHKTETYLDFQKKVEKLGKELKRELQAIRSNGQTVCGYGASGQANTLMAFWNITREDLPYIVDDSPLKIGCFTPNNHIPIVKRDYLRLDKPEYVLCLAYTFYEEIRAKLPMQKGWIVPLPKPTTYEY